MLPPHDKVTGLLPVGIHDVTWEEFVGAFGYNAHRASLLAGLILAIRHLASFGCKTIYADGSFITQKDLPNDIDCCWEMAGVDTDRMEQEQSLFVDAEDLFNGRKKQKYLYGCEFFIAEIIESGSGKPFVDFFQTHRNGLPKGIVRILIEHI